jgi:hypothetical protein
MMRPQSEGAKCAIKSEIETRSKKHSDWRWRRDQAEVVVQAWKASGQTMDEFTEKHGIAFDPLNNLAQNFTAKKTAGTPEKLTFLPVRIPNQEEAPKVTGRNAMHIALPMCSPPKNRPRSRKTVFP